MDKGSCAYEFGTEAAILILCVHKDNEYTKNNMDQ